MKKIVLEANKKYSTSQDCPRIFLVKNNGKPSIAFSVELTLRKVEVLTLVIQGYSNLEICQQLGLSENTVESYLTDIFAKFGVGNRNQLQGLIIKVLLKNHEN